MGDSNTSDSIYARRAGIKHDAIHIVQDTDAGCLAGPVQRRALVLAETLRVGGVDRTALG
jgi:hypothetical protein